MDTRGNMNITVLFVLAAFISVLIHELGHAVAGRRYGAYPEIRLHGFGGVTLLPGAYFSRNQSMWVSAAGPAAGILLGCVSYLIFRVAAAQGAPMMTLYFLRIMLWINVFWTFLNLLPIQPLDGGQIFRDFMGSSGRETVRWVGVITASLVAFWALNSGQIFLCMMMALLAFQNYQEHPGEGGILNR